MSTLAAPLTDELIRRYDVPGPRYTSYPTADRFVEAFDHRDYAQALQQRHDSVKPIPLSVYVHIPFCESLCYYCACNKVITKHHDKAEEYLRYLDREIAMHEAILGKGQAVSQLHFGGGTPTFLSDAELTALMNRLREAFNIVAGAECSIEVDPRTVTPERLAHLATLGFNRVSFGVQDFDAEVQKSVHRLQSESQVFTLVAAARALHMQSINVDLIYGLPKQSEASFDRTLTTLTRLRPDRVALYGYAHLPQRFKPQRRIDIMQIPTGATKLALLRMAHAALTKAGYDYIGMDHFALPNDELSVSKRQGRLHRNFQGYTTQPDCDLIGLGVSAIGKVGASYSQNAKTLDEYYDALAEGRLPVNRGLSLTRDDLVRRAVIMSLMTQGCVDFESVETAYLIDFKRYFARELQALQDMAAEGIVQVLADGIEVTPKGWYVVRAVAMQFDRYLQATVVRDKFSRVI